MQLDGVVVRTIESKSELRHRECVGVDATENDSPVFRPPPPHAVPSRLSALTRSGKSEPEPAPIAAGSSPPKGKGRRLSV